MRAHLAAASAVLLAAACGAGGRGPGIATKEIAVDQVEVELDTTAPFTEQADFPGRVASTIEAALTYWGGTWSDLRDVKVTLTDAPYVLCHGQRALGCYDQGELRFTTRDPSIGTFSCVEQTVLVHEIGHAVLGDPNHDDPRWMDLDSVSAALSGRVGYGPDGEVPCPIYVSVWRHPLGSP
jgi:hypothetical protein